MTNEIQELLRDCLIFYETGRIAPDLRSRLDAALAQTEAGSDPLLEMVEIDGVQYAAQQEVAWEIHRLREPVPPAQSGAQVMVRVPREPTEEMMDAGISAKRGYDHTDHVGNIYAAMLAAAPATEEEKP